MVGDYFMMVGDCCITAEYFDILLLAVCFYLLVLHLKITLLFWPDSLSQNLF